MFQSDQAGPRLWFDGWNPSGSSIDEELLIPVRQALVRRELAIA
jgi:hypothetical protein